MFIDPEGLVDSVLIQRVVDETASPPTVAYELLLRDEPKKVYSSLGELIEDQEQLSMYEKQRVPALCQHLVQKEKLIQ